MPALPAFLPGLMLAVAIGFLIGFERGWQLRAEAAGHRVAGIRTFAMLGLLGALAGIAASQNMQGIALVIVAATAAALLLAYALDMRRDLTVSATGAVAALTTMLLGALATSDHQALAAVAAAVLVALLAARTPLHALVRQSSEEDMKALVRLALLAFLVLPLLPDGALGPYGSLNPRRLWFVVVVIGSISFGGYLLSRLLGAARGGLVSAGLGALISSTAVTLSCAQALRAGERTVSQAGIALASAIMLLRTLVLVASLVPRAFADVVLLLGPALLVAAIVALALIATQRADGAAPVTGPTKPPGLATAFFFAALVALVSAAAAWLEHRFDRGSGAVVIAIGGMVDVDSAVAAIGALPPSALTPRLAALAIAVPVAFNTLLKVALTLGIAGWRRARWAVLALLLPLMAMMGSATVLFA